MAVEPAALSKSVSIRLFAANLIPAVEGESRQRDKFQERSISIFLNGLPRRIGLPARLTISGLAMDPTQPISVAGRSPRNSYTDSRSIDPAECWGAIASSRTDEDF